MPNSLCYVERNTTICDKHSTGNLLFRIVRVLQSEQLNKRTLRKTGLMQRTNEVYRKIKEISRCTVDPRPKILIQVLVQELLITTEHLIICLTELKKLRLIQYEQDRQPHIRLTLLGHTVT